MLDFLLRFVFGTCSASTTDPVCWMEKIRCKRPVGHEGKHRCGDWEFNDKGSVWYTW